MLSDGTYIILDVGAKDAFYPQRDQLIGKRIVAKRIEPSGSLNKNNKYSVGSATFLENFDFYGSGHIIDWTKGLSICFYAVDLGRIGDTK